MDQMFEWKSSFGDFDITPDPDCMMVYVQSHRNSDVPKMQPREIPSWFFEARYHMVPLRCIGCRR